VAHIKQPDEENTVRLFGFLQGMISSQGHIVCCCFFREACNIEDERGEQTGPFCSESESEKFSTENQCFPVPGLWPYPGLLLEHNQPAMLHHIRYVCLTSFNLMITVKKDTAGTVPSPSIRVDQCLPKLNLETVCVCENVCVCMRACNRRQNSRLRNELQSNLFIL